MAGALLLGAYITGIIRQSVKRAELIEELTRTRAALAHERHEAGVRAERERLAAEIHDTLAQGFTSILMLAQAARAALARDPEATDRQLDLVERTARDNLFEARALVYALAPPDLTDRGLVDALRRLAARHIRDTGVPVNLSVAGEPTVAAPDNDVVLLRAVQEALANVRKHAGAGTVQIELSYWDGRAAVTVTDDGRGFDPAEVTEGYGLTGIRSRAAAFGGTCTIRSTVGGGTTISVELR
jgi:signal transduction histidine kinase